MTKLPPIQKVGAVVIHQKQLLACKKKGLVPLISPGGKPEAGETPMETLNREIREELDVGVKSTTLLQTYSGASVNPEQDIVMITYLVELEGEPRPCQEIEGLVWIDRDWEKKGISVAPLFGKTIVPDLVRRGLL